MKALTLAASVLALATPAFAAVNENRLDRLVELICDNGGEMHTSKAATILPKEGFTMAETQGIVAELEKRGQVDNSGSMAVIKLTKKACR